MDRCTTSSGCWPISLSVIRTAFSKRILSAVGLAATFILTHQTTVAEPAYRAVPKANCGPGDRTESGLQGQTTLAERFTSEPARAYNCNLELLGRFQDEGNAGFLQGFDHCIYSATWQNARMQHPGVTVLDVSDPSAPKASAYLASPAMLNPNQSLRVDAKRKLLYANRALSSTYDVYDLSIDCTRPVLLKTFTIPNSTAHFLLASADSRTLYGSSVDAGLKEYPLEAGIPGSAIFAFDASEPLNLRALATWIPPAQWITHGLSLNVDSTRAYATMTRALGDRRESGVVVLDLSEIQERQPKAQLRPVGSLFWGDTFSGELPLPITVGGKPYLVFTDVVGTVARANLLGQSNACVEGKPGYGFARLIDLSDERAPRIVSRLLLEVHDPEHCDRVRHDPVSLFGYGSMFCEADDPKDAKMLACGYFEAGLRVFDIRRPEYPVEIAYYKPPAPRRQSGPGSIVRNLWPEPRDQTADQVWHAVFRKGGEEIWFVSSGGGFHVVRFSERFIAAHSDLFLK